MTGILRAVARLLRDQVTVQLPAHAPPAVRMETPLKPAPQPAPEPPPRQPSAPKRIWIDAAPCLGEHLFEAAEADPSLRVYAFEPNLAPACRRMGRLPNFVTVPLALTEHDGGVELQSGNLRVPTVRLDTFMRLAEIGEVDLLRVDARADDAVLRSLGVRIRDVLRIAVQVKFDPDTGSGGKKGVCDYLNRVGFELTATHQQIDDQEEHLSFVRGAPPATPIEAIIDGAHEEHVLARAAAEERLLARAAELAWTRPVGRYPCWRFDADWENPDPLFQERRSIWEHFRKGGRQVALEVPWYDGLRVRFYLSNDTTKQAFIAGCFEPNEFAFLDGLLKPGMTFIDAGGNEGLYTLFAAARVGPGGRVLAFEPSAREFSRLRENVHINHLKQVEAVKAALSDRGGTAPLRVAEDNHAGHNTLGDFAYNTATLHHEDVPLVRLDDAVRERNIARVDVIKIDVEGHELALLRGARAVLERDHPVLLLELNDGALNKQGTDAVEVVELLTELGYAIRVFDSESGEVVSAEGRPLSENLVAVPVK